MQELVPLNLNTFLIVLFVIFCVVTAIQLYYYWVKYRSFSSFTPITNANQFTEPVSIVICARNEADFLTAHLPFICELDYPNYEVILVNDCSYDNSKFILEDLEKKYSRLSVHTLKEENLYPHDKKFALTIGIKAAKNDLLLLTDADCIPRNKNWIQEMTAQFASKQTEIILGYGGYKKENGFINKLIRFDTFFAALQYFAASLSGNTYMGVGRNLAYRKSLFFKHKGFASHYHVRSGDDDLFINKVATPSNVAIAVTPDAHTLSEPKKNFNDWYNQKRRHLTTGYYYKASDKRYIAGQVFSLLIFYPLFFTLLIFQFQLYVVLFLFFARYISQILIFKKSMEKLGEQDLLYGAPFYEICLLAVYPMITLSNLFVKEPRWK